MSSQHVLIIGAGICGLAIAQGLQKAEIPFTIFEAEEKSTFRPREWTMALHWSVPMLEKLLPDDLAKRLRVDAVVDPSLDYRQYPNNVIPIVDGVTGNVIREIPNDGIRVSRRKLRALCSERIVVQFGHTLQDIVYSDNNTVTAKFSNGREYVGSIIVGADGSRSKVRSQIFGSASENTPLDLIYTNVTFRYPDAEKALFARKSNPVTSLVVHPGCCAFISMQNVVDPQKPEDWVFQLIVMWKGSRAANMSIAETHEEVRKKAETLPEPFRSAFLWMPEDVETRHYELAYWVPPAEWNTSGGRVTLAGDAAHSMPPHRGQGLNNAINDAYNFVTAIKGMKQEDQATVIQDYSKEVAIRGSKEVLLSKETAAMMLDYDKFQQSALLRQGLEKA